MQSALIKEAVRVHEDGHLSDDDIARATGARPSTARAWLGATRTPTGTRAERLIELSAIVERLLRVMDAEYIPVWLRKPNPALGDEKPIDLIADGEYRQVSKLVSAMESPPAT
jgi:Antitoxin Xre/MbcA/ParS C-terminal toxin-binding domain